jgi:hypothetical protein
MQIIYEPHPVTPERKAELVAAGYKIVDAVFAPQQASVDPFSREGIAQMDKADVLDLIEMHGGKASKRKSVESLREELAALMFVGGDDAKG